MSMKVIYSESHLGHDPQFFVVRGQIRRSNEQPERATTLLKAAERDGHAVVLVDDFGAAPRAAVHSARYLHFLETVFDRWSELDDASPDEVVPNIHPFPGEPCTYPEHLVGQVGFHLGDMACAVGPATWAAATGAAHCATHAAELVMAGERAVYALCRPPGHHAYVERANGFCYLNNTAIAAQHLRRQHTRVAVLDIDVHHGNGTQGIFYERSDILTVSLHADPRYMTPFFTGYAHETGSGAGAGYNINRPLPRGMRVDAYLDVLRETLAQIRAFEPGALVIALGLDAYEKDPYKGLAITTEGFHRIMAEIACLGLPTVIVQEGGYLSDALGNNLASALRGFESAA
jgi:acetoin utilization deacetylase AcuC-like enzyme